MPLNPPDPTGDDVLRRMLATPPQPKSPKATESKAGEPRPAKK